MKIFTQVMLPIFLSSFILNYFLTGILIKFSKNLKLIDFPDQRKMHDSSMPVVGGLSIFITVVIFVSIALYSGILQTTFSLDELIFLFLSTLIIILTGLVDDIKGLGPFNKFLFQIIATLIFLIGFNFHFESIFGINYTTIDFIINVCFIVGITNAFNLIDGLDGLAGGVSLIICFTFFVLYFLAGQTIHELSLFIIIAGCLSSFLMYNKTPAKTFLGDTGSLFLGWIFAISSVYFSEKVTLSLSILLPFMVLGLPAFDVIFVMLSRFTKRHGYNLSFFKRFKGVFKPDNTHLHHLFLRGGLSKFKTVIFLYLITLISCIICLIIWFYQKQENLIYGLIFVLLLIFFIRLYYELKIKKRNKWKNLI